MDCKKKEITSVIKIEIFKGSLKKAMEQEGIAGVVM